MSLAGRFFFYAAAALVAQAAVLPAKADTTSIAYPARAQVVASEGKSDKAQPYTIYGWNWNYDPWTYLNDLRRPRTPAPPVRPYTADVAWQHVQSSPLEIIGLAAAIVYVGSDEWGWSTKNGFHWTSEGWFGKNTPYGGMDKLGHVYFSHVLSDFFAWRFYSRGYGMYESAITGALMSGVLMAAIEFGDGFSKFGASWEDLAADAVGIAFSFMSNTVPGFRERFDLRMQYIPTGHNWSLTGDYAGKKFLIAAKLSGFEATQDTWLRYFEIHAGYFARGYAAWERQEQIAQSRHPYVGIGLNLSEVLFSHPQVSDTLPAAMGRRALQYLQVPYTYLATDYDYRGY
jgi:hypothetical protein